MSTKTQNSLRVSRVIAADPDTVFRAWTEPEQLRRWSHPEGGALVDVQVDLVVGGRYRLAMRTPDGEVHTAIGVYREIERPRRLVYTWDWEEDAFRVGETLVTVEFKDLRGSTEVVLTHERFPDADTKAHHEQGWTGLMNGLEGMFAKE